MNDKHALFKITQNIILSNEKNQSLIVYCWLLSQRLIQQEFLRIGLQ